MGVKAEIVIYTDGACSGNPGPGGWAAVLTWKGHTKEISGYAAHTTNNRMELQATIEGLKAVKKRNLSIRVITDSTYIQHAFTKFWLNKWIKSGWVTGGKTPVKNKDLWEELYALTQVMKVEWEWTQGHADNELNNRCDELARLEIIKNRSGAPHPPAPLSKVERGKGIRS
jgi:ribonuclease HI